MIAAGVEARQIATEKKSFHQGIPSITVIADEGLTKRSHKHTYDALGGVAIIMGKRPKTLVYCRGETIIEVSAVMQKGCTQQTVNECFKKWNESSAATEADIILEGFSEA